MNEDVTISNKSNETFNWNKKISILDQNTERNSPKIFSEI